MQRLISYILLVIYFMLFSNNCDRHNSFPVLNGPYLGQKPPTEIPEVFLPGIISTELNEHGAPTFSSDLSEIYWSPQYKEIGGGKIIFMKLINSKWQAPKTAPFSKEYKNQNPFLSCDGERLFFKSFRPIESAVYKNGAFWFCERTLEGWSLPKPLGTVVNSGSMGQQITESKYRNLYYASDRPSGKGHWDIYRVQYLDGDYTSPENLGSAINTEFYDGSPYIAPNEDYIIFSSISRPDGNGGSDLYISFKNRNDTWLKAINLGADISTEKHESFPLVSPDGKFLFFVREGDIYWVGTKFIEDLKEISIH